MYHLVSGNMDGPRKLEAGATRDFKAALSTIPDTWAIFALVVGDRRRHSDLFGTGKDPAILADRFGRRKSHIPILWGGVPGK